MSKIADFNSHPIEGFARMGGKQFSVPLFSQITDNLWTGGCPVGASPDEFQFVISLYPWEPYAVPEHTTHLVARLYDSHDIPDERQLNAIADYVNAVSRIGPTLVHCQAGLNRSALVAGLALIRSGMHPDDAIRLLREKRCDAVLCNEHFERWLRGRAA
ncbi:MAG: dual specificity protein phosphatase family protein [Rhodospirillaceae bacterium]